MFNVRIDRTTDELASKLDEYDKGRKELIDNVKHCTDDKTGLTGNINDDKIRDKYEELKQKYDGYKQKSEGLYDSSIVNLFGSIINTGIDELPQQDATRTLFQTLRDNCITFAVITEHMDELEDDVKDFNGAVTDYVTNKIPDLTERLIACINRSINDAKIKIDSGRDAIKFDKLNPLSSKGDDVIGKIRELLDELAELEAAD